MHDVLGDLQLVVASRIRLHESHEATRLTALCQSIEASGFLRHPPIAVRMQNGDYLVIDGAHRTFALQKLGYKHIPLQVVRERQYTLRTWEHVVPEGPWLDAMLRNPAIHHANELLPERPIAELIRPDGSWLAIYPRNPEADFTERLRVWHDVVESYSTSQRVNRHLEGSVERPGPGAVLLRFQRLTVEDLERVVSMGWSVPAGVTQFEIEGRLLNLCIPLHVLGSAPAGDADWLHLIDQWRGRLRLYTKPVFVCD